MHERSQPKRAPAHHAREAREPDASPVTPRSRRDFLVGLAGAGGFAVLAATSLERVARAEPPHVRARSGIRSVSRNEHGVTFYFELENAPFPAPGAYHRDPTVIVYVPSHYRYSAAEHVCAVVHFHGISSTAEAAMVGNQLREQLFDSRQNAILIVPQGPVNSTDCTFGKLELPGGLAHMLDDVIRQLQTREARHALGPAAIGHERARPGIVCLSTHSGGYHGVAACLQHGEVEVTEVYLFDALYADTDVFKEWVIRGKGRRARHRHKLVTYFPGSGTTNTQSKYLMRELEKAGVKCASERVEGTLTRADLTHEEAIFVQTGLSHGGVTWESNALRDSLFASALPRHMRSSWFRSANTARSVDQRH